ncbi:MAG: transposase, partial [Patescibacteria group bacterium]|nr:transposase [Patescibacteria group bacterium]
MEDFEDKKPVEVSPRQQSYTKPEGFVVGEYYHVYNRGVEKIDVFREEKDFRRFLKSLAEFNTSEPAYKIDRANRKGLNVDKRPYVEIIAYCLNPNHFHLLLKQAAESGISEFMRKIGTGYTMYFNKKYERTGALFQGKFKYSRVKTNEYLLYLSAYINLNCEVHGIAKAEKYMWCSFKEYISGKDILCRKNIIIEQFKNLDDYKKFTVENAFAAREKKEFDKLMSPSGNGRNSLAFRRRL